MDSFIEQLERLKTSEAERYSYTLDTLVAHLSASAQYARLHKLFESDIWFQARYAGSNHLYEDYIADLMVAWERHAHQIALQQLDDAEDCKALVDCVRYALIRTSFNSISQKIVPELLQSAIEHGIWTVQRALDALNLLRHPSEKVEPLLAIFKADRFDAATQRAAELEVQNMVTLLFDKREYSIEEVHEQIAELCLFVKSYIPLGFMLAVQLGKNGELHDETLPSKLASKMKRTERRELIGHVFNSLFEISYPSTRATILLTIFEFLSPRQKRTVIRKLEEVAKTLTSASHVDSYVALLPHLSPADRLPIVQHFLHLITEETNSWVIADALIAIAEYLDLEQLEEGLVLTESIDNIREALKARRALLKHMSQADNLKNTSSERSITLELPSNAIVYLSVLAEIANVIPGGILDESDRVRDVAMAVLEAGLYTSVVETILELIPHIREDCREPILTLALTKVLELSGFDGDDRAHYLRLLIPFLSERLIRFGLDDNLLIEDGENLVSALASLAAQVSSPERELFIEKAKEKAFRLPAKYSYASPRVEAFHTLSSYLDNDEKKRAVQLLLDMSFTSVENPLKYFRTLLVCIEVNRNDVLTRCFDMLAADQFWNEKGRMVEKILPYLDEELRNRCLNISTETRAPATCVEMLIPLITQLNEDQRAYYFNIALERAMSIDDGENSASQRTQYKDLADSGEVKILKVFDDIYTEMDFFAYQNLTSSSPRTKMLLNLLRVSSATYLPKFADLVPSLPDKRSVVNFLIELAQKSDEMSTSRLLDEALDVALGESDHLERAWMLLCLLKHLKGEQAVNTMQESLKSCQLSDDGPLKTWTVANQLLYMDTDTQKTAAIACLESAMRLDLPSSKGRILATLIPYLDAAQLQQVLDVAVNLPNDHDRWLLLELLLPRLPDCSKAMMLVLKTELSDLLQQVNSTRSEVLASIARHRGYSSQFMSEPLLAAVGQQIIKVCDTWHGSETTNYFQA